MLALMKSTGQAVALEPDMIESVEAHPDCAGRCIVRTSSGKEHVIERTYAYVTGVIRSYYDGREEAAA